MKKIVLIFAAVLLSLMTACGQRPSAQTDGPPESIQPETTAAPTQTTTEPPTESPTEPPTSTEEGEPMTDIDPIGLVGTWQRTHAEVEGDKVPSPQGTITIAGPDAGSLTFTFTDQDAPIFNARETALEIEGGQLYAGCGNDIWYAAATSGKNTYALTMLDDNTLLLQLTFDFDGQPMVSTQWFTRSK